SVPRGVERGEGAEERVEAHRHLVLDGLRDVAHVEVDLGGVLRQRDAEDLAGPRVRRLLPREKPQQRGLARAVAAQQAVEAALLKPKIEAVEDAVGAESFGDSGEYRCGHLKVPGYFF